MEQKKKTPATTSSAAADQLFSLGKNVSQASVAALNALAAAYSMAPTNYSPFYPYSMLPFGVAPPVHPNFMGADFSQTAPGFSFWSNMMAPDYMLNMATLQSLQSPPSAMASSNGNVESFSDVLRKMPRPPSNTFEKDSNSSASANDVKISKSHSAKPSLSHNRQTPTSTHHHVNNGGSTVGGEHSHSRRKPSSSNESAASTSAPRYSLAALAEVATSLTSSKSNAATAERAKREKTPSTFSSLVSSAKSTAEEILDFSSRKRQRPSTTSNATNDEPEAKIINRNHYPQQRSSFGGLKKEDNIQTTKSNTVGDLSAAKRVHQSSSSMTALNHKKLLNSLSTALENRKKSSSAATTTASSSSTTAAAADIFTGSMNNLGSLSSSDLKMDPNLLNASAMAWAALSNQLLLAAGMQSELIRTNNQQNNNNNNNHVNNINRATTSSGGGGQKDKSFSNSTSSYDGVSKQDRSDKRTFSNSNHFVVDCGDGPADSVDDTINAVIQSKMRGEKAKRNNDSSASRRSLSPRVRGRRCRTGATVREQLALRRAQDETTLGMNVNSIKKCSSSISSTDDINNDCSALDLSVKLNKPNRRSTSSTSSVNDEHVSHVHLNDASSKQDCSERLSPFHSKDFEENGCDLSSKKRRLAETDLVRVPLTKGWRRQTCIRAISATGIRGDVIYYAPCGRRLGSYAEALRYMNKNKIRDIGREHFSFSCKVLVGEFLHVRPDSMKNGIVPLSEKEVREMVQKFQLQQTPLVASPVASSSSPVVAVASTSIESGGQKSCSRNRNSSSRRRGRPVSGGVPVYTSDTKSKDSAAAESTMNNKRTENQMKLDQNMQNHAIMDALRSTEKEIRRNQMEMLRKQEEEYMRQVMILADWEREKNRQQTLFARALEAKRREEQREQVYAEKLIREEERLAARNAYLLKMRQLRLPIEDLEVEETKPLATLDRIENMSLDGQALADLLMVMEFVHNFGHVLKINADEIPSLDDVHAGLFNDKRRLRCLLTLTKILLILVLEYPGLPNGQQGKTFLGLPAKDSSVNFDNLGELLKMFLQTRGDEGIKLASLFESQPYEALSPSDKVSVLAFMCNELLYCRNVVREIETNIDLAAKLKSDKWTLEGKLRHFKAVQASKQCDKGRDKLNSTKSAEEKLDQSNCSDDDKNDCDDDDTLEKVRLKMIAESEPISVEEKNMSVEEVDKEVDQMAKDLDDMSTKMIDAYAKVRSLPIAQDRFHRYYWTLPNVGGILVESLESAGVNNPSVPSSLRLEPCPDVETVVSDCMRDLVDTVCSDGERLQNEKVAEITSNTLPPSSSSPPVSDASATCEPSGSDVNSCETRKKPCKISQRPVKYDVQRGWWIVNSQEKFNQVQQSFNTHGIRERLFHRSLPKHEDFLKRVTFNDKTPKISALNPIKRAKNSTPDSVALTKMRKVFKNLQELEDKVFHANVHVKTWKPPDFVSNNDANDNDSSSSSTLSRTISHCSSSDDIASTSSKKAPLSYTGCDVDRLVDIIRKRLVQLEQNVERRYFHPAFNRCSNLQQLACSSSNTASAVESRDTSRRSSVVASEMSDDVVASLVDGLVADQSKNNVDDDDADEDTDDVTPAMNRWRVGVAKASSAAQLAMCLEALDAHIAWERSVMKASCQICRRGDDDSQLLLCDGCDLGYHMYCFKPKIDSIPDGDWYCPECVSKATRRPCCLLCCRQTTRPMIVCADCQRNFHTDCVIDTSKKQNRSSYICDGCVAAKTNQETSKKNKTANDAAATVSSLSKKAKTKSGAKSPKQSQDKKNISKVSSAQSSPPSSLSSTTTTTVAVVTAAASSTNSPLEFHEWCSIILAELDAHKDSWPFKTPVDTKSFPLYKKIIKRPSDLTMIQMKLTGQKYENADQFVTDVKLIFDNCKTFNEDDSPVGKAGHTLRRFFNKRWKEFKEMSARKS